MRKLDLSGQRFGRLVVLNQTDYLKNGHTVWHCKCDCGNYIDVKNTELTAGDTLSCGCLKKWIEYYNLRGQYDNKRVNGVAVQLLNAKKRVDNTSGYKGINIKTLKNGGKSYRVYITVDKKQHYLGAYREIEQAIEARKAGELKYIPHKK